MVDTQQIRSKFNKKTGLFEINTNRNVSINGDVLILGLGEQELRSGNNDNSSPSDDPPICDVAYNPSQGRFEITPNRGVVITSPVEVFTESGVLLTDLTKILSPSRAMIDVGDVKVSGLEGVLKDVKCNARLMLAPMDIHQVLRERTLCLGRGYKYLDQKKHGFHQDGQQLLEMASFRVGTYEGYLMPHIQQTLADAIAEGKQSVNTNLMLPPLSVLSGRLQKNITKINEQLAEQGSRRIYTSDRNHTDPFGRRSYFSSTHDWGTKRYCGGSSTVASFSFDYNSHVGQTCSNNVDNDLHTGRCRLVAYHFDLS